MLCAAAFMLATVSPVFGAEWIALGTGMNRPVIALVWDGSNLYAGGDFGVPGGVFSKGIAKWDGSSWSALGTGVNFIVVTLAWDGSNLYAGGEFTTAGGVSANGIAKWDGTSWSALGSGMNAYVYGLLWNGTTLYAGGNFTTAGGVIANRVAKWGDPIYTITYNGNGATSGTEPADQTKNYDVDLTLATNTGSLAKTGHTFNGWNTATDGSGDHYDEGATYTTNAALTLYAEWTANTYTVTYEGNGNTGGAVPVDASSPYVEDATVTVLGNTGSLVRTGFNFNGWNTAADGSSDGYFAGETFTMPAANVTLYAQWTAATHAAIPTLSEWGMIIFAFLMAVMSIVLLRRRNMAT